MKNVEHRIFNGARISSRWMFGFVFRCLLLLPMLLRAQAPPQIPPGGLIQLQVAQPAVDISSPVTATAVFDPPAVRPGEKTFYRVTVDATESSIQWPDEITAPQELKLGPNARGQLTEFLGTKFRPLTSFIYEVRATATGQFAITNFTVDVDGKPLEIPAAAFDAVGEKSPTRNRRGSLCWKLRRRTFFSASRSG